MKPRSLGAIIVEQSRRPHGARDDDGIIRHLRLIGDEAPAGQLMEQPVGEIVEIVQPLAEIGIGLALQASARVVLHPLDGGFGGKAGHDRLAQAAHPAAVIGEHAEGFENFTMLARAQVACAINSSIE